MLDRSTKQLESQSCLWTTSKSPFAAFGKIQQVFFFLFFVFWDFFIFCVVGVFFCLQPLQITAPQSPLSRIKSAAQAFFVSLWKVTDNISTFSRLLEQRAAITFVNHDWGSVNQSQKIALNKNSDRWIAWPFAVSTAPREMESVISAWRAPYKIYWL